MHLKVFGGALVVFVYAVAGMFLLGAHMGGSSNPLSYVAGVMAGASAYGATVLLRALIGALREEKRRELECDMCGGTGYSGDSAVPNGGCWDCRGTGLYNGGEK